MDPDVTLAGLVAALEAADLTAAREHMAALDDWLSQGGFPPRVTAHAPTLAVCPVCGTRTRHVAYGQECFDAHAAR